ncbi:beta-ketoacyl synthase N-terminal-like domain-containing protein [Crocosphaera sp. Alani8]|uniref:beta-ketoacyl synthase N-terminal-like domain-containing protein n=1 Tax=Crocosphaera sp. Alani8 TaxID=3038952 RepID=UPI00313CCF1F
MNQEPIAIIGINFRFPQADTPEKFWHLLTNKRDAITQCNRHLDNSLLTMQAGFIEDIDRFDADFFNISHDEACLMSPQQRLLLESTWLALEDAGIIPQNIAGSDTSLFISTGGNEYYSLMNNHHKSRFSATTGNNTAMAANRISNYFDLHGASVFIDTACSSSLVAIHQACNSIYLGESSLALAGGANLILTDGDLTAFTDGGMIASDGRCKVFDANADGYVQGEGVAMIVLKPLSEALKNGDRIYGQIIATGVNHNGKSNTLTSPNLKAQVSLLERIYEQNKIDPNTIDYIETHAVGTTIGDALELKAIGKVFSKNRPFNNPLKVGSVKPNIGHTENVSGMASLIKTLLCLHSRKLTPNLHFHTPNTSVKFDKLKIQVQDQLEDFNSSNDTLRMAISAFGFGGTNAHILIEEAPQLPVESSEFPVNIFTLSAKSESALLNLAKKYLDFIIKNSSMSLTNLCYSTCTKRTQFNYRWCTVIESISQLEEHLTKIINQIENKQYVVKKVGKKRNKINALSVICEEEKIRSLGTDSLSKKLLELGEMWLEGINIEWDGFYHQSTSKYISIPTYAFDQGKYWFSDLSSTDRENNHQLLVTEQQEGIIINEDKIYNLSEIESKLIELWKYCLNKREIDREDNFFHLGGTSLQAVNLSAEMQRTFKSEISSTIIFEYPTLKELSQVILENRNINGSSLTVFHATGNQNPIITVNTFQLSHILAHDKTMQNYPLYNLNIFKLSSEIKQNILQIPPENTLEKIANYMVEDIIKGQLKQPYNLISFCGDSHLTLEIASQLNKINHQVDSIILIDGIFKNYNPSLSERYKTFKKLGFDYIYLKGTNVIDDWFKKLSKNKLNTANYEDNIFYQHYLLGRSRYVTKAYPGNIHLLLSTEWQSADLSLVKEITSNKLKVDQVLGLHNNLIERPYVDYLIQKIHYIYSMKNNR